MKEPIILKLKENDRMIYFRTNANIARNRMCNFLGTQHTLNFKIALI